MSRPKLTPTPSSLGDERAGILNMVAFGWLTAPEAAEMLGCTRETVWRLCRRFGIDPIAARRKFKDRCHRKATRYAHRDP